MGKDVIALGDLVADLILPIPELPVSPGKHQLARGAYLEPGGAGNFLIMSARLGLNPAAIDRVGEDFYGRRIRETLDAEGVDVSHVELLEGAQTTLVLVIVAESGEHVFLGVLGASGLQEIHAAHRQRIIEAGAFYTNGHTFLIARSVDLVLEAIGTARDHGVPVFFDPGPQIPNIEPRVMEMAIAHTNVLLLTQEEAALLAGGRPLADLSRALLSAGPSLVVIKMGAEGCFIADHERSVKLAAFPVKVVDTCGAGDAFDAACVYGYLHRFSLDQIASLANAVGAATVARLGTGTRLPHKKDIVTLLERNSVNLPLV
ncbi:MAG TPA: carbohydrate kinase family protein [Anaerolineales bacterium]|nr:carbohydrate kinase family protein [Anaerolineales bacterium]